LRAALFLEDEMAHRLCKLFAFLLAAFLFLVPGFALGQARTSGQLSGTVVDASGAGVPGATLTLSRSATGFTQTVTANESGAYVFPDVQPGTYQLSVSAKGFAPKQYNDVVISAARTTDQKVELSVGSSSQTVEVSAASEVLETTSNTLATTVSGDSIQDLPLGGRDALPFAELVPGAQSGGDERFTTYNAMPNGAINISVDGMNNNFQRYRTSTTGFFTAAPVRIGAVDEVTVSTDDLTADAGSEGAVTLRFVTKRGTNQFHGSALWQHQNSFLNANTFTNDAAGITKPPFHINDYAGNIGGPIWKNKLFFFFNYEEEDLPGDYIASQSVLTAAAEQGNYTYTGTDGNSHTVNVLSIAAANGFPSTVNALIGSQLTAINGYLGNGKLLAPTTLPFQQQLTWFQSTDNLNRYPTLRLDYQVTPKVTWHGSMDVYWRTYTPAPPYPGDPNTDNAFQSTYAVTSTGVDWTITPHLVNQFNFGLLNTQEEFNAGNSFNPFTAEGNVIINAPSFFNGAQVLATTIPSYMLPEPRNNPVWDWTDNMTWTRGNHTFTFGGDFRYSNSHDTAIADPPSFNLGINASDPAIAMFNTTNFPFLDTSSGAQQDVNAENLYATLVGRVNNISGTNFVDSTTHQYKILGLALNAEAQAVGGLYFQDAWKATPHLSFNYGFRWQFTGAITNTDNLYTSPTYADLLGPSNAEFQPGQLTGIGNPQIYLRPRPYRNDFVEPAPNFGFAWNPDKEDGFLGKLLGGSSTVIRGGAAISHYDEGWTTFEQAGFYANPGSSQSVFLNTAGSLSLGDPTPNLPGFPSSFTFPQPESGFTFQNQSFGTVDPNIRAPYIENWNFGIQRKLPGNTVVEVNYVGNHSVHMWTTYDLNEVNIFENGFLSEFKNAQTDYTINGGTTFADNTGKPGLVPLPILDQAFGGAGSAPFTNSTYLSFVQSGQAGALANQLIISPNSSFFCNLVGNTFSPCVAQGFTSAPSPKVYPINMFQVNPYASGEPLMFLSDPGSESYNGLQINVKHPIGHGLNLMVNYAFSHSFTNRTIGDYFTADQAVMNFPTLRDPELNRSPSPYDIRHIFRTYFTYDLPFGPGKVFSSENSVVNKVIGGWTTSSIVVWQTGRNFRLLGGTNTYNYFDQPPGSASSPLPDASDSGVVLNGITVSQLQSMVGSHLNFNSGGTINTTTPVVLLPQSVVTSGQLAPETTPGVLGSLVYLHGPTFFNTDFSLIKSIPIWERLRLNFYTEFLNIFNHPNWNINDGFSFSTNNPAQYANVSLTPTAPGALANEANGAGGSRDIQFRLELKF